MINKTSILSALTAVVMILVVQVSEADSDQMDYTIIGSSIGTWWAPNYVKHLEVDLHTTIVSHNYYVSNQLVSNLLNQILHNTLLRDDIQRAEIITIGIGFMDFYYVILLYGPGSEGPKPESEKQAKVESELEKFRNTYDAVLSEVDKLTADTKPIIRTMDFYFPYVAAYREKGVYEKVKNIWMRFNGAIIEAAKKHGIPVAGVFQAFNGETGDDDPAKKNLLDTDGKHPSVIGMQVIADEYRKLGYNH